MKWRRILSSKAVWLALAAVLLAAGPALSQGRVAEAVVAKVADGDTLSLTTGERVRLLGLDTPELGKDGRPAEFMALQAKEALARLVLGKTVRLEYDQLRYDHYGRLLAHLFLPDNTHVNAEMVRQGLARVYTIPPNLRFRAELVQAQREALAARRGIWQQALKQTEPAYLGNRTSFRFHRPTCHLAQKIGKKNRVHFAGLIQAYQEGFSPCRTCKP